jgi:hypothetical protein
MMSLFGLRKNNKNKKLKEEIDKITKAINELLKNLRHTEPAYYTTAPLGVESIEDSIKRILKDIEQYKKSLESYDYNFNLHHFPEIYQLENSLRQIIMILKHGRQQMNTPRINGRLIAKNINQSIEAKLQYIQHLWKIHEDNLHRFGIVK